MNTVTIAPGKNNVGAYIHDINLSQLNDQLSNKIKDTLDKYGVIFIKKQKGDNKQNKRNINYIFFI